MTLPADPSLQRAVDAVGFDLSLLDMVGESIVATTPDGVILHWNHAAQQMYGWSAGEVLGRSITDLLGVGDLATREWSARLKHGQEWSGELWVNHRDGHAIALRVHATPVRGDDGTLLAVVEVADDITEHKIIETQVRARSSIVDSSVDAIMSLSLPGLVTTWNAAAETMYGFCAAETMGRHISLFLPARDVDIAAELHARALMGLSTSMAVNPLRRPDGSELELHASVAPIRDPAGTIVGSSAIVRDVTEANRLHRQATTDRARLIAAQAVAHIGSFEDNLLTGETWWSEEYLRLFGRDALDGDPAGAAAGAVPAEDLERLSVMRQEALAGNGQTQSEHQMILTNGEVRWLRLQGEVLFDADGLPVKMIGSALDITDLRRADDERRAAEERFRLIFERSPFGMTMADLDLRFTAANPAMGHLLGCPPEDVVGKTWQDFLHPADRGQRRGAQLMRGGAPSYKAEYRVIRSDGEERIVEQDVSLVRDDFGSPSYFFSQMQDITERKLGEAELQHQASHDPLTGLPNRLLLVDRIGQALARKGRIEGRVVALFLDIDQFKVVNDGLGHAAGDALLEQVAHRLRTFVRGSDTLGRFGGDEFVIVCDNISPEEIDRLADRIVEAMKAPFDLGAREMYVSASIGIAVATSEDDAGTLLRNADAAMYQAKERGRACTVRFDDAMHRQVTARIDTESGLRAALATGGLRVYYQPLVDMRSNRPVGVEALVRWMHPTRGLIQPADFIPVAEETGLIVPIGAWVLNEALKQVQAWRTELPGHSDLRVSVNLSARQLQAPNLLDTVSAALEATGMPARAVYLEITESLVMNDVELSDATLLALRSLGVGLAVDDFGTGYSSLSYLKRLPVNSLKIDRSFVDGLGEVDSHDASITRAIIGLAQALDLAVIAEGVETLEQRDALLRLGARIAQGYLWSAPLAADEIALWLAGATPAVV